MRPGVPLARGVFRAQAARPGLLTTTNQGLVVPSGPDILLVLARGSRDGRCQVDFDILSFEVASVDSFVLKLLEVLYLPIHPFYYHC